MSSPSHHLMATWKTGGSHCDINTKDAKGRTILHKACINGDTSLVRHLVTKYSCDLNARDNDGDTPCTCAGLGGSVGVWNC